MNASGRKQLPPDQTKWLREGALGKLLDILDRDGEEARVVGGAVRNMLLGVSRSEIDVATTAEPKVIVERVTAAGFKAVPTGIEHGTVTAVANGEPFEVTALREDIETDGRHAVVRFGRDWAKDAARRDFTINALSLSRDGTVHDYCGGLADIEARRVRFIGDADMRIAEDYLRVLRFFRFFAAYGQGEPDRESYLACARGRDRLAQLSRERVRVEILKLLVMPRALDAMTVMADAGIFDRVFANAPELPALGKMIAAEEQRKLKPDAVRRLAAVAVRVAEDAEHSRERLRLSNEESRRLASMADCWWRLVPDAGRDYARETLYRIGADSYRDRALLAFAHAEAAGEGWEDVLSLPERWTPPRFPLVAKDFMARGVDKGPALGRALASAEDAWIAAGFPEDPAAVAKIADAAAAMPVQSGTKRK